MMFFLCKNTINIQLISNFSLSYSSINELSENFKNSKEYQIANLYFLIESTSKIDFPGEKFVF